ncbi:MAG TPA: sigma-70 family RNA polymerase sigma factor [Bryobacteraceae bacterium]|nr:sigma-70 family RNA polymerase sigma factor [Bryobacteraceae bacterium]
MLPLILAVLAAGDGDLLARLQRRDPQALAELYDRYGGIVFRLILRMVRDSGTAEDLVQETFLRVWNRAGGFDGERGAVGPWLLAVARNRAIDHLRARGGRAENTIELNEIENPALFAAAASDPLHFDLARHVKRALGRLTPQQREAIELAYFEGMSQTEIAERMGQPLGTVKTWMRRALELMREVLPSTLARGGGAVAP